VGQSGTRFEGEADSFTNPRNPKGALTLGCGGGNCVLGSDDPPLAARRTLPRDALSLLPFNSQ